MQHTFTAKFNINGTPQTPTEMTYDDNDIIATLNRRLKTAFPNATNISIARKPDEQLSLAADKKTK